MVLWLMEGKGWTAELQIPLWGFFPTFPLAEKFLLMHPRRVSLEAPSPETEKISSHPLLLQHLAPVSSGNVWLLCHSSGQCHTSQIHTGLYSCTLPGLLHAEKRGQNSVQFGSSYTSHTWRVKRITVVMLLELRTSPSNFIIRPVALFG